jgi:hypothetical protein
MMHVIIISSPLQTNCIWAPTHSAGGLHDIPVARLQVMATKESDDQRCDGRLPDQWVSRMMKMGES